MKRVLRPFAFLAAAICLSLLLPLLSSAPPNGLSVPLIELIVSIIAWLLVLCAGVLFIDLAFFGSDKDMTKFIRPAAIWLISLSANISLIRLGLGLGGLALSILAAYNLAALLS